MMISDYGNCKRNGATEWRQGFCWWFVTDQKTDHSSVGNNWIQLRMEFSIMYPGYFMREKNMKSCWHPFQPRKASSVLYWSKFGVSAMSTKVTSQIPDTVLNLSIFRNVYARQPTRQCKNYRKCKSLHRVLSALKYYSLLKPQESVDNEAIFAQFVMDIYKYQIFDDFNHITHSHGQQIHDIMNWWQNRSKHTLSIAMF